MAQLHSSTPRRAMHPGVLKAMQTFKMPKESKGSKGSKTPRYRTALSPFPPRTRSMKQTLAGKHSWLIVSYRALAIRADLAAVAWVPRGYKYGTQSSTLGFQTVIF